MASNLKRSLGLAACLAVCASAPAFAQGYDPLQDVFEAIGLKDREKPQIDYRERPPLVVPPNLGKLRQPEKTAAERNPNWPQDPDVLARKRKIEEGRVSSAPDSDNSVSQGGVTRTEVLGQRNRYGGVPASGAGSTPAGSDQHSLAISPEQVKRILADGQAATAPQRPGVEPDRQYLTEPPKGYRKAAAGAPMKATTDPLQAGSDAVDMNILQPKR